MTNAERYDKESYEKSVMPKSVMNVSAMTETNERLNPDFSSMSDLHGSSSNTIYFWACYNT